MKVYSGKKLVALLDFEQMDFKIEVAKDLISLKEPRTGVNFSIFNVDGKSINNL